MHRRLRIVARRLYQFALFSFVSLAAAHCARIQELGSRFFAKSGTATVKGTVSGLNGTGLIISVNGQLQSVSAGNVSFASSIINGDAYTLAVAVQPSLPAQVCIFTSPTTGVASDGAILFALQCNAPPAWGIQGTTTGYAGSGLQVQLNGGEIVTVTGSSFSFSTNISDTQPYNVQVKTQPTGPAQICTAQRNVGVVTGANVTDISINCSTVTFSVGGFVTGLASGASVTVQVNGTQSTSRSVDGFFTFMNKLADQTVFDVVVQTQPTGQTCSVSRGSGIVDGPGSYAALIQCSSTTHTISGTISGLSGGYTTLVSSGGEYLPVTANGAFSFTKNFALNSDYVIEVFRNPAAPAQTCTVANATGTITANVTNVAVSCTTTGYSIGGTSTISGLTSAGLVLRLNGSSDVAVAANSTSFNFSETIASGSSYSVTIASQPTGQKCTLSNASGTAGATVTNVTVNCVNGYTVGGTVTGYTGSNLVLRNTINGTPLDLVISSNTAFTFPDLLVAGDTYSVAVANFPETPYQNCTIANAAGTIAAANITNVNITCTNVTLAFTAVSSTPSEAAGAHGIALSLVGTTPRAGSVQVTITGGSATDTLDYTLASTTISWAALATPGNVVANIIDDAFNEGNETLQISLSNPVGITLGAQTTHTVTITDNDAASAVGAVIATAEYYDADRNGKIDHVKITFDKPVKDSSQVGWVNATTNIAVSSQWLIAGYSGVQFVPQVCIDRSVPANGNCTDGGDITDVVDNAVIWLKFTESSTYDTGATPDLTGVDVTLKTVATSPNDCYIYTSGATCQTATSADFATGAVAEADKAEPILVAAWSDPIIDAWQLRLQFSEAADTTNNAACGTVIVNTDFTYNNTSGSGASSLRTDFADSNGCDVTSGNYYIMPRVDSRFIYGDLNSDTVTIAAAKFYDTLGNASIATTKTITYDPNLELYYPMDAAAPISDSNTTVYDVSGNGRNGTITGGAKLVKDMSESTNQAYGFPTAGDNITATGYKGILARNSRTVALWIKAETDNSIIGWGTLSSGADFKLIVKTNSPRGTFQISTFGGGTGGNLPAQGTGWRHFAATYDQVDGTNITNAKLYVDGILVTSLTNTSVTINTVSGSDLYITNPRNGKTDEVRVYSRALTATEIKKLAVKVPGGLVAQYALDNSGTENSGNTSDLTLLNSPVAANDRYARANSALTFNATNTYGSVADNATMRFTSGNSVTLAGWINPSGAGTQRTIVAKGRTAGSNNANYVLRCLQAGDLLNFYFHSGGTLKEFRSTNAVCNSATWMHVAVTYQFGNASSAQLYVNGLAVSGSWTSGTGSEAPDSPTDPLFVGAINDGSLTHVFNGQLDDVRVYNRALTAGEVAALATELDRGLVAYYPLDDNVTSGTVADYSGQGNDLTIGGGTAIKDSDRLGVTNGSYRFDTYHMLRTSATGMSSGAVPRSICLLEKKTSTGGNDIRIDTGPAPLATTHYRIFSDGTNAHRSSFRATGEAASPVSAGLNIWNHVCGVYDVTNNQLFVNGVLQATTPYAGSVTSQRIALGDNTVGGGNQFIGSLDDVRIYDRALSVAEIRELSGFSPGQVDNNTFWLDAGRAAFNNAGTTLATNTQSVQQWNDISFASGTANAKNVSQATSGKRPTLQTNVINGQSVLRFDGIDDQLEHASLLGSDMFAANEANFFVVQKQSAAKDLNATFYWHVSASNRAVLHFSQSDLLVFDFPSTAGSGRLSVAQPTGWDDAFHLTEAFRATTQAAELKVDSTLLASGTRSGTLGTGSTTTLYIGSSDGGSYNLQGDIAEILVYKRGLTATERDKITCYLSKKYAIAVSVTCD